jgi:hypothetical protein
MSTANTRSDVRGAVVSYLSLFTSVGTLFCCALPSLLVLLGMGATVASVLSALPFLVALSHHKPIVFSLSGVMIALGFVYTHGIAPKLRRADLTCDPNDPSACTTADKVSRFMLWFSATLWAIGAFVAFLLGPILTRFD